jgi:hypothetical protein
MTNAQTIAAGRWWRLPARIVLVLLVAVAIGMVLNRVAASLERNGRPAGFSRGMLQGALMPMSMPNLLVGRDITIYSLNNTGINYKLGYTLGVNGCGAFFFGFMFWRLHRWRSDKRAS